MQKQVLLAFNKHNYVILTVSVVSLSQPGSCVVDPMCGVGTILIEAAKEHMVTTPACLIYRR